jgi:lipopolysaccharide transport system permease protein
MPLGVFSMVMLGSGIGLLLLPFGLLYTDVQRLLSAFLPLFMLITPVIYPAPKEGIAQVINKFNPVSPLITTTRDWMFGGDMLYINDFLVVSALVAASAFIGIVLFRLAIPIIRERSGSDQW